MLNNQDWRTRRLMTAMLKRARKARGRMVRGKNLGCLVKWVNYKNLHDRIFEIGVGRVSIIGRWPRMHVLDTMVFRDVYRKDLLNYYLKVKHENQQEGRK